jgi:ubiquinone/menaquinone biosynthesis C-methylase UbiE
MDSTRRAKMRRTFFKNLAPVYDSSAKMVLFGYYYHMRRQLREKIDIKEGMRVLDIASGTGYVAEILHPADVVCTDITKEMLTIARTKTNASAFVLADVHQLPFKDGVFDAAVSSFAMHEMAKPKVVLDEMFRALKPGGDMVVMDVVQQTRWWKKIQFQIFHTWVDQRAANYMKLEELKEAFGQAEHVQLQWEMEELVALMWGKKRDVNVPSATTG